MKQTLFISSLAIVATLILTSAQKKHANVNHAAQVPTFKFNKYITVTDSKKTCNITIKVSGNNGQELTDYSTNSFAIEPMFKEEEAPQGTEATTTETTETESPAFIERTFDVVGERLPEGAVGFKIFFLNTNASPLDICKGNGLWGHSGYKTITIDKTVSGAVINSIQYSTACGVNNWSAPGGYCPNNWGCAAAQFTNTKNSKGIAVNITDCKGIRYLAMSNACK